MASSTKSSKKDHRYRLRMKFSRRLDSGSYYTPHWESVWCSKEVDINHLGMEIQEMVNRLLEKIHKVIK